MESTMLILGYLAVAYVTYKDSGSAGAPFPMLWGVLWPFSISLLLVVSLFIYIKEFIVARVTKPY